MRTERDVSPDKRSRHKKSKVQLREAEEEKKNSLIDKRASLEMGP